MRSLPRRERRTSQSGNFGVRIGMSGNAPAALWGLGDKYPGPLGQRGIAGRRRHDLSQLVDDAELLVSIQNVDGGENLDPNVVALPGCVGNRIPRQLVNE